jgi:predicted translin family RNA/ssDNA-binding protein
LITKSDLPILTIHEYVNGLADFTGEIGRLAVMYASERQIAPVQLIQQLDIVIYDYITKLNILNNNSYFKKMDMISMNAKKVDDIIYEMTLLQMNGKVYRLMPNNEPMPGTSEKNNNNTNDDTDL